MDVAVLAQFGQPGEGPAWITIAIGIIGLATMIFAALRFRRDDTTAIVNQQNTLFAEMQTLNAELRTTTADLRTERDALKTQVARLTSEIDALHEEVREGRHG